MKETGFYFYYKQKDYFFITQRTKRTVALVEDCMKAMGFDKTKIAPNVWETSVKKMQQQLQYGICELKTCSRGDYYDIHGEDWGGCGDFVAENKTVIIKLAA